MTGELPPDVVIDVSNVCCDRRFDDTGDLARWDRLEAVIDAYRQQVRPDARVLAYADSSLARKLDRSDRRHLKEAQRDGWLVVCDVDADARVLQTARDAAPTWFPAIDSSTTDESTTGSTTTKPTSSTGSEMSIES